MAGRRKAPEKEPEAQAAEAAAAESAPEGEPAPDAPVAEEAPKAEKKSSGKRTAASGNVDAHVTTSGSVAWMEKDQHHHGETGTNITLPKEEFDRLADLGMVERGHVEGAPSMYQEPAEEISGRQASEAIAVESEAPDEVVTSQR